MQNTPNANRLHIAMFGRTNSGKSSLINALTGQNLAIVSDTPGTTTDPVSKAMEILPIGPVLLIDTAGLDDYTELGKLRVQKSMEVLNKVDVALIVIDISKAADLKVEEQLAAQLKERKIPYLLVVNKIDLHKGEIGKLSWISDRKNIVRVSASNHIGIEDLKKAIIQIAADKIQDIGLLEGLITANDTVLLVTPIDSAAPKGRMILPQMQVLRDILDRDAVAVVTKEDQLTAALNKLAAPPKLVITDSQVFKQVDELLPADIPLTSFSILFARQKGDLAELTRGAQAIEKLRAGDKILVAEACTHYRTHEDIGTVKIPNMLQKYKGCKLNFVHTVGFDFADDLSKYALVIHCGACMINRANMLSRIAAAKEQGVPMVNYGMLIAYVNGILAKSLKPFIINEESQ